MANSEFSTQLEKFSGMPAADFLLHRESMLLLDRLVETRADSTVCEWQVMEDGPFVVPKLGVPAYSGIEFMAQCIGVHAGARARVDGFGPPLGFLLGTRHLKSSMSYFAVGEICRVTCEELIRDGNGMGSYDCRILLHNNPVAEARLCVLEKGRGQPLGD